MDQDTQRLLVEILDDLQRTTQTILDGLQSLKDTNEFQRAEYQLKDIGILISRLSKAVDHPPRLYHGTTLRQYDEMRQEHFVRRLWASAWREDHAEVQAAARAEAQNSFPVILVLDPRQIPDLASENWGPDREENPEGFTFGGPFRSGLVEAKVYDPDMGREIALPLDATSALPLPLTRTPPSPKR